MPASPGAASGYAVFDADRAEELAKTGAQQLILVREETKPEDIHGFFVVEGILTSRGGKHTPLILMTHFPHHIVSAYFYRQWTFGIYALKQP